jgi:hypothetical protein
MNKDRAEYYSHLDNFLEEPLFKNILAGKSSFANEAEKFYDITDVRTMRARGAPPVTTFYFKKEKKDSSESPSELIAIINPFSSSNKDLDASLLNYNSVIEDNMRFKKSWPGRLVTTTLHFSGIAGVMTGSIVSFENPYLGISITTASFGLAMYTFFKKPFFPNTNSFDEFRDLYSACRRADNFIPAYKDHFVSNIMN